MGDVVQNHAVEGLPRRQLVRRAGNDGFRYVEPAGVQRLAEIPVVARRSAQQQDFFGRRHVYPSRRPIVVRHGVARRVRGQKGRPQRHQAAVRCLNRMRQQRGARVQLGVVFPYQGVAGVHAEPSADGVRIRVFHCDGDGYGLPIRARRWGAHPAQRDVVRWRTGRRRKHMDGQAAPGQRGQEAGSVSPRFPTIAEYVGGPAGGVFHHATECGFEIGCSGVQRLIGCGQQG